VDGVLLEQRGQATSAWTTLRSGSSWMGWVEPIWQPSGPLGRNLRRS